MSPGVTARQVLYRSTDALGEPMAVSGTVLVPTAPWAGPGSRPLVSYAVGTRSLGDDSAPSYTLSQGAEYEGLFVKGLLDQGWAVAVSDYQGLGTPGLHTYLVGPAQGHAVLDMARRCGRLGRRARRRLRAGASGAGLGHRRRARRPRRHRHVPRRVAVRGWTWRPTSTPAASSSLRPPRTCASSRSTASAR
jgi:hypothetical protein